MSAEWDEFGDLDVAAKKPACAECHFTMAQFQQDARRVFRDGQPTDKYIHLGCCQKFLAKKNGKTGRLTFKEVPGPLFR